MKFFIFSLTCMFYWESTIIKSFQKVVYLKKSCLQYVKIPTQSKDIYDLNFTEVLLKFSTRLSGSFSIVLGKINKLTGCNQHIWSSHFCFVYFLLSFFLFYIRFLFIFEVLFLFTFAVLFAYTRQACALFPLLVFNLLIRSLNIIIIMCFFIQ